MALVGLIVGIAAAIVVAGWLGRQVFGWVRGQPMMRIKLTIAFPKFHDHLGDRHLAITARNIGRSPATVTRWWLRLPDGTKLYDLETARWSDRLPATVERGNSASWFLPADELVGVVDDAELKHAYAVVGLSDGKTIRCLRPIPVRDLQSRPAPVS